jgi:hypothetical protein
MNAPATIRATATPGTVQAVRNYVPHAEGQDLELRCQLMKAQEHCAALLGNGTSAMGHSHVQAAYDIAGAMVFRHAATLVQLKAAVDYCRALCKAAMCAEILDGGLQ